MIRRAIPWLGLILTGVAIGLALTSVILTLYVLSENPQGDLFFYLSAWTMGLLVGAAVAGALAVVLWMTPWQREQYQAKHAQRPRTGLETLDRHNHPIHTPTGSEEPVQPQRRKEY